MAAGVREKEGGQEQGRIAGQGEYTVGAKRYVRWWIRAYPVPGGRGGACMYGHGMAWHGMQGGRGCMYVWAREENFVY